MQLSRSVPIVLPGTVDPVGTGWVESLARPGGNVTGFTALELPMFGKTLEILKQIAPATTHVGLIYNPDNPTSVVFRRTIGAFAGRLAVEPVDLPIHKLADLERALVSLADRPNASVFFLPDLTVNALRAQVIALVERGRLPAMCSEAMFVKSGGLAFYGVDRIDLYRRAAGLKGDQSRSVGDRAPSAATAAGRSRRASQQDRAHRLGGDAGMRTTSAWPRRLRPLSHVRSLRESNDA